MSNPILQAARVYADAGLSCIPTSPETRTTTIPWKQYQERKPTEAELRQLFKHLGSGLGIVTGKVSGNLEIIDFDFQAELYPAWQEIVNQEAPNLLNKLIVQRTQNDGRHSIYRCPGVQIPGNTKLAQRGVAVTDEVLDKLRGLGIDFKDEASVKRALPSIEVKVGGKAYKPRLANGSFIAIVTLIETRGEGGQFLADPGPGYEVLQGSLTAIPEITLEERNILIRVARSLNEWVDLAQAEGYGWRLPKDTRKPGDDFNERGNPLEILIKHGWEPSGARGDYQHLRRPGKNRGQSASLIDGRFLHVFSSNAYPFEPERTYAPFAVYALLECEGDFNRAAVELAKKGFGSPMPEVKRASIIGEAEQKTFLPLPPPFPLEVFPEPYQQVIVEVLDAYVVPVEIPACTLLSVAGASIGRIRGILIKPGWIEHGNLWLAIVGLSGIGKSPVVRAIYRPIFAIEREWFDEYKNSYEQYKLQMEARKLTPKKDRDQLPLPPEPPKWNQLFVDDATTEALTDALASNPRGILWNRDELAGLILELDKYTGKDGGTKSRLMSSYDSGPWKVNRRDASKKAYIPHATLSIFGTIQPKALPTIFSNLDAAIGFLPRFIFVNFTREAPPLWTDRTVSEEANQKNDFLVKSLLALNFANDNTSMVIGVSREARSVYENWFNDKATAPWRNTEAEVYEAVLAKLRGQCLRIALILHCIEAVTNGRSEMASVSLRVMNNAIRLANYFEVHQKIAWQTIISEGKAAELSPLQRKVIAALLNLEYEIQSGMLPTARITKEVNRGLDHRFQVSSETVGKAAASLGLISKHLPDKSGRGVVIEQGNLEKFKYLFQATGPTVLSVRSQEITDIFEDKAIVPQPSLPSGEDDQRGRFGLLPDTCSNADEAHGTDGSDGSDTSLHTGNVREIEL